MSLEAIARFETVGIDDREAVPDGTARSDILTHRDTSYPKRRYSSWFDIDIFLALEIYQAFAKHAA